MEKEYQKKKLQDFFFFILNNNTYIRIFLRKLTKHFTFISPKKKNLSTISFSISIQKTFCLSGFYTYMYLGKRNGIFWDHWKVFNRSKFMKRYANETKISNHFKRVLSRWCINKLFLKFFVGSQVQKNERWQQSSELPFLTYAQKASVTLGKGEKTAKNTRHLSCFLRLFWYEIEYNMQIPA